ncbi:MAG: Re/Si-specific NAD(P)(+) transhydrogenase subunit alpha [Acidobacteria bacterium]|nr:MAG: Re/Si-specific NAD(P)(+) transhydrogenase subunit alpha [Acidobacteriota bacterium]REK02095.1 MAG: Re/Si-specific NAD(P)(+) transhydrogenase subunit alpha [Acidobacteriota bacterium]REK15053.1 MAG: Re/Si-specific NAD(P)(+) transhydrogenase subunit alpha [Acidobacteriota bacterium]REK45767.1 MAG: Re/Si-specific NAD(P)(+) transhydrogenase subunit alpha [Acidobacteriota bacterium]
MQIGVPREQESNEKRVALVPDDVKKLVRMGAEVCVEAEAGRKAGFSDDLYRGAGAEISAERSKLLAESDVVLRVRKPPEDEVGALKKGAIHVSFLDPFNETALIESLRGSGATAISMEMIPRTTLAQKMDALSSQANLAGYVMVILGCSKLPTILPMMMTPAGTLKPATVFIIGAGVAGLQAIATARRLGAKVVAFDTRAVVAEQVESLGAKFLEIDLGETGQTKDGYAVELTPEQRNKQLEGQKKQIAESDVVITTAQVFGRKPPVIVTADMVKEMKPGSVIVDMAAETGGNVEGSVPGETIEVNGVTIIGNGNWTNVVARDASVMYSANLRNLIDEFWNEEAKEIALDFENEIVSGCVITHGGEVVNETIKNLNK